MEIIDWYRLECVVTIWHPIFSHCGVHSVTSECWGEISVWLGGCITTQYSQTRWQYWNYPRHVPGVSCRRCCCCCRCNPRWMVVGLWAHMYSPIILLHKYWLDLNNQVIQVFHALMWGVGGSVGLPCSQFIPICLSKLGVWCWMCDGRGSKKFLEFHFVSPPLFKNSIEKLPTYGNYSLVC